MNKTEIEKRKEQLLALTSAFCSEKLNDEYRDLCEKLIQKLSRKRNVPFQNGKIEIWAAAVVHALASINFLFDNSFEPYLTRDQIVEYFGTKKTTVSNKARQIKDILNIGYFDREFSTQGVQEKNPFNKMVMVNGCVVPITSIPEEMQELVKEARAKGEDIKFTIDSE